MRARSAAIGAIALFLSLPVSSRAQREESRGPFFAVAVTAGAVGFTDGGPSNAIGAGYGYAAFKRIIIGAQGGATAFGQRSRARYAMATLAYPAKAIRESLVYPYVGVGTGSLRRNAGAVFGAGIGVDCVRGQGERGLLVGMRGGYLYRSGDAGERAIYLGVAMGMGGRSRKPADEIIALHTARRIDEAAIHD